MRLIRPPNFTKIDKHRYVQLIEFSLSKSNFAVSDAMSTCSLTEKEFRFIAPSIYHLNLNQVSLSISPDTVQEWVVKPEAYFSYLQFMAFSHAIETAERSYWLSLGAIILAILSIALALK